MPSRLSLFLSQLGPKPGGADALSALVEVSSLPGDGWRVVDERTWRTGRQKPVQPWARRAADAGSVTAWRSFGSGSRTLWVQLVPTASEQDARLALSAVPEALLANLRAGVRVDAEADVPAPEVTGADATWAHEQHTSGHPDAGRTLLLAWTVGACLHVACAAGRPEWGWPELAAVAGARNAR